MHTINNPEQFRKNIVEHLDKIIENIEEKTTYDFSDNNWKVIQPTPHMSAAGLTCDKSITSGDIYSMVLQMKKNRCFVTLPFVEYCLYHTL